MIELNLDAETLDCLGVSLARLANDPLDQMLRELRDIGAAELDCALPRKAKERRATERREQREAIARALSVAKKAGLEVTSLTVDGVTVRFDYPATAPAAEREEPPRSLIKIREKPKVRVVL
ncbi:MAG TPA: hypothetical protein VGG77_07650 [Roseiarcus sp.]|jgi:hypothetical protein